MSKFTLKICFVFVSCLLLIYFTPSCKDSTSQTQNSNIQVRITKKFFVASTCKDKVSDAVAITIKTVLQNTSEFSGTINDWELEFYKNSKLLLKVTKINYEDYACGNQIIDMSDQIVTSGYFNYYGFIKFSFFKNQSPDKVIVTLTIKDKSGYSYKIMNTY